MSYTLSGVDETDAESLVRNCDFPAMRDNPLHLLMFPHSTKATEEVEIKWSIEGLRQTLNTKSVVFRKVCLPDRTPVGFAGWSLDQTKTSDEDKLMEKPTKATKQDQEYPETLDVRTWIEVSKLLRAEKMRVLKGHKNIWRKFDNLLREIGSSKLQQVST